MSGLRDFLARVHVHNETMGKTGAIGRAALDGHGGHERGLEPSAVLVGRLKVEVGRIAQFGVAAEDRLVAHAGVDPHVERVVALGRAGGQAKEGAQLGVGHLEPRVRAAFFDEVGDAADERGVEDRLALRRVKHGQRHAPTALAADAPVGARLDGAGDALDAPVGDPRRVVDGRERVGAQGVDADEKLFDRAEDDRRLGPPTVRVRMLVRRGAEQGVAGAEVLDDERVGLEDQLADPFLHAALGRETPEVVHRAKDVQPLGLAEMEVVRTVARRDMHAARAGVHRDEIRRENLCGPVEERVAGDGPFERGPVEFERFAGSMPSGL